MNDGAELPLDIAIVAFAASAAAIALAGTRLARLAARIAARSGIGEAVFGAVFLGGATSLPGIVTSVAAARAGHAELAVSNAIGGIAAQTVFLVLADALYRRANLEHAAASLENITWGALLIALLAIPIAASFGPEIAPLGVHPASLLLPIAYLGGVRLAGAARDAPMWSPAQTPETVCAPGPGDAVDRRPLRRAWLEFGGLAAVVAVAGLLIAWSGTAIVARSGLSESIVGTFFTAIATSLPELVTAIAAVRHGALALAVADVLGGNAFDVLFVAAADIAWLDGSIYHAIGPDQLFVIGTTILMTAILLLGLLRREKHGIGNIGFESAIVLATYATSAVLLIVG